MLVGLVAGCATPPSPAPAPDPAQTSLTPTSMTQTQGSQMQGADTQLTDDARAPSAPAPPVAAGPGALALIPAGATHATLTDYERIKARLDVSGLTSEDLMTDRLDFWRRAEATTVLLTDGLLRADNSRLDLRHDVTQDDVSWEVRWATTGDEAGAGYALSFRPDLPMERVAGAVADQVPALLGADVEQEFGLLTRGAQASGPAWIDRADLPALVNHPFETMHINAGCVPFLDALGADATSEHVEAILETYDVDALLPVTAVAVAFSGDAASVRVAYPAGTSTRDAAADMAVRADLAVVWPTTESIGFSDGFQVVGAVSQDFEIEVEADASVTIAQVSLRVRAPGAAAQLALSDLVPVGICNEARHLPEPTGLP